ncbi:hypothetical protein [Nostoc sp.]|uniref:hypothetical protein n=1 Tax=Nostoc sp. TaxID=1180 RepID=UPI002FFBF584
MKTYQLYSLLNIVQNAPSNLQPYARNTFKCATAYTWKRRLLWHGDYFLGMLS